MQTSSATAVLLIGAALLLIGCNHDQRLDRAEKEIQELEQQVKKRADGNEYELSEKCAKDAKMWFRDNWSADKDTLLLTYSDHYNKSMNVCFISIEYHTHLYTSNSSWSNNMSVWDVNENTRYGQMSETHETQDLTVKSLDTVLECSVAQVKCASADEYEKMIAPYLRN